MTREVRLMLARMLRLAVAPLVMLAAVGTTAAEERTRFETQFRQFVGQHCIGCHGPEVQKRKLRLDQLPVQFDDKAVTETWVKVYEQLAHGDMPPRNKPRPPEKDLRAILDGVKQQLH